MKKYCHILPSTFHLLTGKFLRKNPVFVPEIIPYRKEPTGYKLTNVRCNANRLETLQNQKIHQQIDQTNDHITAGYLGCVLGERWVIEHPVPLQQIVDQPPHNIRNRSCRPQRPVQAFVERKERDVARPKERSTAH